MYYDGTKLLSLSDINGNKPEIYICTSNRTGGKTTYFNRLVVNRFFRNKSKFMLLFRYNYELDNVADKFFKDISTLFFPEYYMRSEKRAKGVYHDLFICNKHIAEDLGEHCGYAVAINNADQIKKMSHLFSDTQIMVFDEFQSENDKYCPNEVQKFISVHTSVARGQGKMTRYLPVIMISNPVSLINPYYTQLKISHRLRSDTKFLRGKGFVLEQGWIETASRAMQESAFNQAFEGNKYLAYASQNIYLNDNYAFIEPPTGNSKYLATIMYMDKTYAIRTYPAKGIVYCDNKADLTYQYKISVTTEDHRINYIMLEHNDIFISGLRKYFNKGCFRFRNLECKEAAIALISNRLL
jgi:hypothetical protein